MKGTIHKPPKLPVACLAAVLCSQAAAQTQARDVSVPAPVEIGYDLQVGVLGKGEGRLKIQADGNRLSYWLRLQPTGLARLVTGEMLIEARLRVAEGRVLSEEYIARRQSTEKHYVFSLDRSSVKVLYKGESRLLEIHGDTLDEASMQLQLILDARQGDGPWDYTAVSNGKIKHYRFTKVDEETISSAFGNIQTIRIERVKLRNGKEGNVDYLYWLSPAHRHLPVRVEKRKDGKIKRVLTAQSIRFG